MSGELVKSKQSAITASGSGEVSTFQRRLIQDAGGLTRNDFLQLEWRNRKMKNYKKSDFGFVLRNDQSCEIGLAVVLIDRTCISVCGAQCNACVGVQSCLEACVVGIHMLLRDGSHCDYGAEAVT